MRLGLGVLTVLAGSLSLCPDDVPTPGGNVQVTVLAILASEHHTKIDEKIKCIAAEVRKCEPGLKGFRLERTTCKSVPVGQEDTFPLVDEKVAQVKINHGANKDNWVGLTLKAPGMGEITYSVLCGK